MNKIGFIGAGNLAASVIKGLKLSGKDNKIYIYDIQKAKTDFLAEQFQAASCPLADTVIQSDVIILAVKPKDMQELLRELTAFTLSGKLIITVAAGIGLQAYEEQLPEAAIVRVMPNTSSAVLQSVSGMARGKHVTEEQAIAAEGIFSALGKVLWIEDSKINALTAVSGSGPAYFYLFTELMAEGGARLGLSEEQAEFLAKETLIGAGKMLAESGKNPRELREAVTSPNGTTYAALQSFLEDNLDNIIHKAMLACLQRAEKMEGEY